MRVLLVDDHALLLEGLQNLLEEHGIEVAGVARDGQEAAMQAQALRPDVILMDIRMPVCDGLTATRVIKAGMQESKIVILTTSTEDEDLFEAVKAGACGYLLKSMDADTLVEALHDVELDIPPFAPGLAAKLLAEFARPTTSPPDVPAMARPCDQEPLSQRQNDVLALVAQGLSYKEVGAHICLSPRTVKYHMAEIMRKLHLQNRAQVLAYVGRTASDGES
ncbi:MAG: response regulator transcription factor [Thermoleophilia bacterium]|nr:response regulator transcription factor [Thermoleophilia bacterium]